MTPKANTLFLEHNTNNFVVDIPFNTNICGEIYRTVNLRTQAFVINAAPRKFIGGTLL